jgi:uncharacterized protein YhaN
VRIERIQIDGFGKLRGLDTGPDGLPGLVTVFGPNEAGKSTLFTFLTTALYGFLPATRDRNPQVPWGADEAAGRVRVRLDGGGCAEVERRLRSQPHGRLALDGVTTELRNQPLPWVEHVPRTVFRQVFAITLSELAGLDSETWARIQDKVVGTMGASDLRSARAVAEALEREAGEIWRPNRRGNQRLRELQARMRDLRARRSAAHDRDARVRALVEEAGSVREGLQEARQQRHRDRVCLERAQSLLPLRQQLDRIASLRREGGDFDALAGLPEDPPVRLDELEVERARLRQRVSSLDAELAEREADVARFDERARRLLARREEIARLTGRAAVCAAERARAAELEGEMRALEQELDAAAPSLLDGPWRDVAADVEALPVELLRDRVARARLTPPPVPRPEPPRLSATPILLLASGSALLAWGLAADRVLFAALGAGLAAVALTLVWAVRSSVRRAEADARRAPSPRQAVDTEVRRLLAHLPVRAAHLERPGEPLVAGLARLQALLRDRTQRLHALDAARARVAETDAEAVSLAGALGEHPDDARGAPGRGDFAGAGGSGLAERVTGALDSAVRDAERVELAASSAEREARRLRREREDARERLEALRLEIVALRSAGTALSPDARTGLVAARSRLAAHRRADELREEIERAHPDLHELEAQLEAAGSVPGSWGLDDEQLAAVRTRLEGLEEEIERLVQRSEALARDAAHLRELETVDSVDGEIEALRELEGSLMRERDRKWVLAKLLREADRRFREEHQPDLLRRASSYLRHLTAGRYERLVVDERGDGGDLFQIVGPGLPAPVPLAAPVSTGTLEQAYLSLRLAIVDHLDQGGERLPLFVDEVFVNWDAERRSRGLQVLTGISDARQVFVFTCHEGLTAELRERGAATLPLETS